MANERRSFAGAAVATTLTSDINASATTLAIADSTGWPSGSGGDFFVVLARGTASEEKVRCASRSSLTITVATSGRGADGTTASSHSSTDAIELCLTALDLDEANAHLSDADHLQSSDIAGSGLGISSGVLAVNVDGSTIEVSGDALRLKDGGVNVAKLATDAVTTVKLATDSVTTAKILAANVTTAKIAAGAVTANELATDSVTAVKIAAGAVGVSELATDSVTAAAIATDAVGSAEIAANAVTSSELADASVDTAAIIDASVTAAKHPAMTADTPTLRNDGRATVSATVNYAHHMQFGKLVIFIFRLTATSTSAGSGAIKVTLPVTAATAIATGHVAVGSAVFVDNSDSVKPYNHTAWIIDDADSVQFLYDLSLGVVPTSTTIGTGDILTGAVMYEAA